MEGDESGLSLPSPYGRGEKKGPAFTPGTSTSGEGALKGRSGSPEARARLTEDEGGTKQSEAAVKDLTRCFDISQPAVSQHLKVLRDSGLATVRPEGTRRLYAVNSEPLRELDAWLDRFRCFWTPHLEALATELARGRRERRLASPRPKSAAQIERGKAP